MTQDGAIRRLTKVASPFILIVFERTFERLKLELGRN
jgi:hypothetical protein